LLLFFLKAISGLRSSTAWEVRLKMPRTDGPGTILTFILGAGVGALAALLLAPKPGEELRNDLAEGVNSRVKQLRRTGKDLRKRAGEMMDLAKNQVQAAIELGDRM
jgi:gas vesicle protein